MTYFVDLVVIADLAVLADQCPTMELALTRKPFWYVPLSERIQQYASRHVMIFQSPVTPPLRSAVRQHLAFPQSEPRFGMRLMRRSGNVLACVCGGMDFYNQFIYAQIYSTGFLLLYSNHRWAQYPLQHYSDIASHRFCI